MKKAIALAGLIMMTVVLGQGMTANDKSVEAEIRQLNAREVVALLANDVKALGQLWSEDFVVTNPFNKFINKQQVVGLTQSGTLAFTAYDRQIEYVRIYDDTAIVAGTETVAWGGKMPTAGQISHLRFTAIWMKQGGRWQEVARHANMIGSTKL